MNWVYGTLAVFIVGVAAVKVFSKNSTWTSEETFTDKNNVRWTIKPEMGTFEGIDYSYRGDPVKGYEYDTLSHFVGANIEEVKKAIVQYAQGHMP